jgi:hypothetical protein
LAVISPPIPIAETLPPSTAQVVTLSPWVSRVPPTIKRSTTPPGFTLNASAGNCMITPLTRVLPTAPGVVTPSSIVTGLGSAPVFRGEPVAAHSRSATA